MARFKLFTRPVTRSGEGQRTTVGHVDTIEEARQRCAEYNGPNRAAIARERRAEKEGKPVKSPASRTWMEFTQVEGF